MGQVTSKKQKNEQTKSSINKLPKGVKYHKKSWNRESSLEIIPTEIGSTQKLNEILEVVLTKNPNLSQIDLSSYKKSTIETNNIVTNETLELIARKALNLRSLRIPGCSIDNIGLAHLAKLESLMNLDLCHCGKLKKDIQCDFYSSLAIKLMLRKVVVITQENKENSTLEVRESREAASDENLSKSQNSKSHDDNSFSKSSNFPSFDDKSSHSKSSTNPDLVSLPHHLETKAKTLELGDNPSNSKLNSKSIEFYQTPSSVLLPLKAEPISVSRNKENSI